MSIYDSTVDMLSILSTDELKAVNGIVKQFAIDRKKDNSFVQPLTKAEMMDRLAQGRADIANGEYEDSETMEKELAEEYGF